MTLVLEPYIDGYIDPSTGNELTVIPRIKFPFKEYPRPETYTRQYERDYEVNPRALPRINVRTAWTNLITYSEQFDNAAWTKTNATVTANNTTAPDGLVTMDKLLESSATGEHSVSQAATVTAAAHEVMVFIKGGLTRGFVRVAFTDSAATTFSAYFSTTGYSVSPSAGVTAKAANMGNSDICCVLRFTPAAGAGTMKINIASAVGTISYAGNTANGIYVWGAQVALGSVVPYISTTSATRSILAPDRDPRDPMAYLIKETDPDHVNARASRVTRTFGRVPMTQIFGKGATVTRPSFNGSQLPAISFLNPAGSTTAVFDPDFGVIYYAGGIFGPTKGLAWTNAAASAGTFTLTYKTSTTGALAYNASQATIDAAVNALADVVSDGLTFAIANQLTAAGIHAYLSVSVTAGTTATPITMNASSLTVNTSTTTYSSPIVNSHHYIALSDHLAISNHGFDTAKDLLVNTAEANFLFPTGYWGSVSADVIRVPSIFLSRTPIRAAVASRTYSSGVINMVAQVTETYALPGVTPGITTDADIEVPNPTVASGADLLTALMGGITGYAVSSTTGPDPWDNTAIYVASKTELDLSAVP